MPRIDSHVSIKFCRFIIRVPLERRITAEIIEGNEIVQTCDDYKVQENSMNEKLVVSFVFFFFL